jgi:ketosteroid isomerase-like protein
MNAPPAAPPALARVRAFFESLTPDSVARIGDVYTTDAYFKDPFNEVRGQEAIERIFRHMFVQVQAPRFVLQEIVAAGDQAFVTWDFVFRAPRMGSGEQTIRGASHLRFASDGRIGFHRDYWDAAEELYEKLPVLGGLMRWLKRRAAT